jgi:hypothetical protein
MFSLMCGCAFVALATWLSSGTMSPYAITVEKPKVLPPCGYLGNPDHPHFEWTFAMLNGEPRSVWEHSIMLRRILFPLMAFPAMKLFGFLVGGVLTSVVLQVAALVAFAIYVRRRIGETAALAAIALLATYPGIYYWAGLPYPHVTIVPLSLVCMMIAAELERATTMKSIGWLSLGMGVCFLGYDLAPFFVPAAIGILLMRKRLAAAAISLALMLLPMALVIAILKWIAGVKFYNENTSAYFLIFNRYFTYDITFSAWMKHIAHWPVTLAKAYLWHSMVFLPALFLVVIVGYRRVVRRAELFVLLSGLLLFLFINLAPPHRGWQFRGEGMSRIYQPVFAAMLLIIARAAQDFPPRWLIAVIALTCMLNASIALGPATKNPLAAWAYHKFYQHAPGPQMIRNLEIYGRRPLGVCAKKKKKPASVPTALSSVAGLSRGD